MTLETDGWVRYFAGVSLFMLLLNMAAGPARPSSQEIPDDPIAGQLHSARSFDFGAFCLSDIPKGTIVEVGPPDFGIDGTWRQVVVQVNKAAARKPRIFFFGGIRRESGLYSRCGADLPPNVRRILEGNINEGKLKFRILDPAAGFTQAFEIDHDEFKVEIGRVRADFLPLYGGKVAPEGVRLEVSNVGRFVANPRTPLNSEDNLLTGQLRIGSYGLTLRDAKLLLPGTAPKVRASFGSGPDGVALNVDIPSGQLSLYKGVFRATAVDLPQGLLTIGGAEFDLASGRTTTLDLVGQAEKGEPLMRLGRVSLAARTILHTGPPAARLTPTEPVTIGEVAGPLAPDQGAAHLMEAQATNVRIPKAAMALGGTLDRPALEGHGSVELAALDAASISGKAHLATPDLLAAKVAVSELAAREIRLQFQGEKSALKLVGQLDMIAARLRTLDLAGLERTPVGFDGQMGDGELGLRFSVDASTPAGRWSFADPTGAVVMLEGAVRQFKAAGTLWLGSSASPPRMEMDPGAFRLAADGTVVRHTLAFGTTADQTSLSTDVDLQSASGFTVTKEGAEGRVELATNLLVLTEPSLSFNDPNTGQFRIQAPLRFDAGAILGIQLADLGVTVIQGHAIMENLGAEGLTTDPIKLADLEVTSPRLSMERLEIDVRNEVGTVKGRGLVFEANGIKHTADPQWEIDSPNPRIPELEAKLGRANNAVVLKEGHVRDLEFHAGRGSYRSRDGFAVSGEGITVQAVHLSESSIEGGRIAISRGAINLDVSDDGTRTTGSTKFDTFEITADGQKQDIIGRGGIHLADLQIDHRFPILRDKCDQDLQLKASLGVGAVDIGLRLEQSELHGNVRVDGPRVRLSDTSFDSCEWNDRWKVDVVKLVTTPVCWIPFIGKEICKEIRKLVKIPVQVPIRYRVDIVQIDVTGSADRIDLDLRGARGIGFCVHGAKLDSLNRIQLFSVRPTFQASGDVGEALKEVIDTIVGVAVGAVESALGTLYVNNWSLLTQLSPVTTCG